MIICISNIQRTRKYGAVLAATPTHLPVGEEDDALDGEELQHRVVRSEKVLRGEVEEEEGVEGHRDAGEGGLFNSIGSYTRL